MCILPTSPESEIGWHLGLWVNKPITWLVVCISLSFLFFIISKWLWLWLGSGAWGWLLLHTMRRPSHQYSSHSSPVLPSDRASRYCFPHQPAHRRPSRYNLARISAPVATHLHLHSAITPFSPISNIHTTPHPITRYKITSGGKRSPPPPRH